MRHSVEVLQRPGWLRLRAEVQKMVSDFALECESDFGIGGGGKDNDNMKSSEKMEVDDVEEEIVGDLGSSEMMEVDEKEVDRGGGRGGEKGDPEQDTTFMKGGEEDISKGRVEQVDHDADESTTQESRGNRKECSSWNKTASTSFLVKSMNTSSATEASCSGKKPSSAKTAARTGGAEASCSTEGSSAKMAPASFGVDTEHQDKVKPNYGDMTTKSRKCAEADSLTNHEKEADRTTRRDPTRMRTTEPSFLENVAKKSALADPAQWLAWNLLASSGRIEALEKIFCTTLSSSVRADRSSSSVSSASSSIGSHVMPSELERLLWQSK